MVRSRTPSQGGGSQGFEMERKYSVPSNPESRAFSGTASEDLHAWSIYRQNLNSDFTDSALGSTDKSPLPYGNFQLRDTTVQSILSHPRYGPKSALGSNMYTYLKFGLPRVFPPNHNGSHRSGTPQHFRNTTQRSTNIRASKTGSRGPRDGSSGYDSSDNETTNYKNSRKYRSDPDFRMQNVHPSYQSPVPQKDAVFPLRILVQMEIEPVWLSRILWTDEGHFSLNSGDNTQNCRIWSTDNPHETIQEGLHHKKVFVWCGFTVNFVIGPYFKEIQHGKPICATVIGERYLQMLQNYAIQNEHEGIENIIFMQDGALVTLRELKDSIRD